jgi:hydroxybutyrate-dimer hydrolase
MLRNVRLAATYFASASVLALVAATTNTPALAGDEGVIHNHYDGVTNDLLTAGLGKSGLGSATPPSKGEYDEKVKCKPGRYGYGY